MKTLISTIKVRCHMNIYTLHISNVLLISLKIYHCLFNSWNDSDFKLYVHPINSHCHLEMSFV